MAASNSGASLEKVFGAAWLYSVQIIGFPATRARAMRAGTPPGWFTMLVLCTSQFTGSHGRPGNSGCCQ